MKEPVRWLLVVKAAAEPQWGQSPACRTPTWIHSFCRRRWCLKNLRTSAINLLSKPGQTIAANFILHFIASIWAFFNAKSDSECRTRFFKKEQKNILLIVKAPVKKTFIFWVTTWWKKLWKAEAHEISVNDNNVQKSESWALHNGFCHT